MFPILQGSAETLNRRGGKLYRLLIAYFQRNIRAKIIKIQGRILKLQYWDIVGGYFL